MSKEALSTDVALREHGKLHLFSKPRDAIDKRAIELAGMLTYKRPHKSASELEFINRYIMPLKPEIDESGNLIVTIGDRPSVMFSSHTDSVHGSEGRQDVLIVPEEGVIELLDRKNDCLGADCATGVWIMRHMIKARVAGVYVFHRNEERGATGSNAISSNLPDWLADIKAAIAVDRRGYDSIVTEQCGGATASRAFGDSLAAMLTPFDIAMRSDPTGVFTDTANYSDIVPECSNISVGYFKQHSGNEYQDYKFALKLLDALIALDWSQLVISRDPNAYDDSRQAVTKRYDYFDKANFEDAMLEYVLTYPDKVAKFLKDYRVTESELDTY
jgi:hypothetical protein